MLLSAIKDRDYTKARGIRSNPDKLEMVTIEVINTLLQSGPFDEFKYFFDQRGDNDINTYAKSLQLGLNLNKTEYVEYMLIELINPRPNYNQIGDDIIVELIDFPTILTRILNAYHTPADIDLIRKRLHNEIVDYRNNPDYRDRVQNQIRAIYNLTELYQLPPPKHYKWYEMFGF